jgi:hypothetical protein
MSEHQDIGELERHEELLQKKEERLQTAHSRRMETEPSKGGVQGSKSAGHGFGEFFAGIAEHKGMFAIIGLGIVAVIIVYYVIQNQNSGGANTANAGTGLNPAGGILPSDISMQLASINDQLSNLGSGNNTGSTSTTTTTGTPETTRPGDTLYAGSTGVPHYLSLGGVSINQIASELGIAASSIYRIPENIKAGYKSGSSIVPAGSSITLPKGFFGSNYYEVTNGTTNNSLASIAQLEGISLTSINGLNPNLTQFSTLLPNTEVRIK